jgi:hypothetical protein
VAPKSPKHQSTTDMPKNRPGTADTMTDISFYHGFRILAEGKVYGNQGKPPQLPREFPHFPLKKACQCSPKKVFELPSSTTEP